MSARRRERRRASRRGARGASAGASVGAKAMQVALVMMDNRPPDLGGWLRQHGGTGEFTLDSQAELVTMLTAYLNMRYACRHGYTLLFYQLRRPGCMHPLWGSRHPSYCKLTAIGEALAGGYEWVVYLDSDAFVRARHDLPSLLQKYGAPEDASSIRGPNHIVNASAVEPEAFFGWDHPFTLGPNMGFIALRNTEHTRAMVRVWWNAFAGTFSMFHPFEQHTLQWQVMHLDRYMARVQTLSLRTMDASYPDDVVHLDHNAGTKTRIWVMAGAAAQLLIDLDPSHSRPLRRFLRTLQRNRKGLSKKERRPIIEAVVRAARRDLDSASFERTCTRSIQPFNATGSALKHLWHGSLGADTAESGGGRVADVAGLSAQSAMSSGSASFAGMPLQLANCSMDPIHAPWQTWRLTTEERTAKGATCQGLCLAHRFSLVAAPHLCLSLGTTRTPRNPFQTQAQLAPCLSVRGETPAAMRARLHFSSKARTIKTTHRVADFRLGLPEHRTSCGFWPACSGTRLLLPKPCWARLEKNVSACGPEEESVANILERDRHLPPAERAVDSSSGFVVGASGPVPASMLNFSGRDRLCLTAWRGKLVENAAAVFLRCPQGSGRHSKWRSSRNFEWSAVDAADGLPELTEQPEREARRRPARPRHGRQLAGAGGGGGAGAAVGGLVRVTPRATPQLCLAAAPIASPALALTLAAAAMRL